MKNFKNINQFFAQPLLMIVVIALLFVGCTKKPMNPKGAKKVVEGIVLEDCVGNVSKGKKVSLEYHYMGCFGGGLISEESTLTDNNGHFKFVYREAVDDGSTTSYYYLLKVENSSIDIQNPSGNLKLYPNDTLMNAIIHLKFKYTYHSNDTFFYQFRPSPNGIIQEPEQLRYFVGPFHDTTIILKGLRVGNTNSEDKGIGRCGAFKWGLGKRNLVNYYSYADGFFNFIHEPCAEYDSFDYLVNPSSP